VIEGRKSYRDSLEKLWKHYYDTRNEKKLRLVEDELKQFHMMNKHLYDSRLELPSEALQPRENVSKCNEWFREALYYKGLSANFNENQHRSEVIFQAHPGSTPGVR